MAKAQEITRENSTITPLGAGGVFIGTADDVSRLSTISIFMESDRSGTLSIEVSQDQDNWIVIKELEFNQNTQYLRHQEPTSARWVRIVYVNGNVAQDYFRLQTIYHLYKSSSSSSISEKSDSLVSNNESIDLLSRINDNISEMNENLKINNLQLSLITGVENF